MKQLSRNQCWGFRVSLLIQSPALMCHPHPPDVWCNPEPYGLVVDLHIRCNYTTCSQKGWVKQSKGNVHISVLAEASIGKVFGWQLQLNCSRGWLMAAQETCKKLFQLQPCETSNTGRHRRLWQCERIEIAGSIWSSQIRNVGSVTLLIVKPTGSWIIENRYNLIVTAENPARLSHTQTAEFSSSEMSVRTFSLDLFSFTSILVTQICGFLQTSDTVPQCYSTALETDKQLHYKIIQKTRKVSYFQMKATDLFAKACLDPCLINRSAWFITNALLLLFLEESFK